jgi:tetratricopeptide (TPR) repeat protein
MVQSIYPNDFILATKANYIYPNNKPFLFWLFDSTESNENRKKILNKILSLDSEDANVLTLLGIVYWENNEKEEAMEFYKQSCKINDRKGNGCYYVARTYELFGDIEKAIYYYRLSYWPPSWEKADQLEAELSTQNP